MVLAIRYDTTTQEARSIWPKLEAIAGSAVATMVWSATAINIGSMIGGKTVRNCEPADGSLTTGVPSSGRASGGATGAASGAGGSTAAGWFGSYFLRGGGGGC